MTAIVGPNGSGKTTLLKAISGDLAYSGGIAINGRDLSGLRPWQAAEMRAVLPQATTLAFPFTVREIVTLGLMNGRSGAQAGAEHEIVEEALARVDLDGFAGRYYQQLSGGEQQRVQLARVLCQVWLPVLDGAPRWLLLDEPVSSLDIRHQLVIMEIARDFAARGGGVVAVLHDLNLAAMHADVIYAIRDGRVAASGRPAQVLTEELMTEIFGCPLKVAWMTDVQRHVIMPGTATEPARA